MSLAVVAAVAVGRVHGDTVRPADAAAAQVIERFNQAMVGVLTDAASLGYKGRFEKLRPVLMETFDLDFMAEKAVGRFWRTLSEDERAKWRSTFAEFMCANYASRLTKFNSQKFELLSSQSAANETVVIDTQVVEPKNDNVQLSYRMRQTAAGWRIIDVYYNGTVSELALRRADYAAVLKADGFPALIVSVDKKIADMEAGASA
jgi:phospholipid transport system substrate-binding protein